MFSFQCSVRRKRAGAAGSLPSMRVRLWRTSRQWLPQVSTNWSMPTGWVGMGPNREKRSAQLCTFPNMPTQANTIPAHPGTSPNMPARSCTTVEPPSPTRKPLYERLHRWIRSSFAFRGGRQAGLGRVAKALKSNDLCTGASLPRRPAFREKLVGNVNRRRGGGRQSALARLPSRYVANASGYYGGPAYAHSGATHTGVRP